MEKQIQKLEILNKNLLNQKEESDDTKVDLEKKVVHMQAIIGDLASKIKNDFVNKYPNNEIDLKYCTIDKVYKYKYKTWLFLSGPSVQNSKIIVEDCMEYEQLKNVLDNVDCLMQT